MPVEHIFFPALHGALHEVVLVAVEEWDHRKLLDQHGVHRLEMEFAQGVVRGVRGGVELLVVALGNPVGVVVGRVAFKDLEHVHGVVDRRTPAVD